jgi:hypothetical protein
MGSDEKEDEWKPENLRFEGQMLTVYMKMCILLWKIMLLVKENVYMKKIIKENEPIEEPIIRKDENGIYTTVNKSIDPEVEELLNDDESKRKIPAQIPDPVRNISEKNAIEE